VIKSGTFSPAGKPAAKKKLSAANLPH
jgi:hypothetical protein